MAKKLGELGNCRDTAHHCEQDAASFYSGVLGKMSRSYRLFFVALSAVALVGIALTGPVWAQPASAPDASALTAQWEMVRWAQNIFWIALSFLALCLAGVAMIALTLRHTKRAADAAASAAVEAEKATKAANDAVDVARDTAQSQLRAYVGINKVYFGRFNSHQPIEVIVEIQNFGVTPAYNVDAIMRLSTAATDGSGAEPPIRTEFKPDAQSLMPSGVSMVICHLDMEHTPSDVFQAINAGQIAVCLQGTVRYTDIAGQERFTDIRKLAFGARIQTRSPFLDAPTGNGST
jgi:hypothetical protein